MTQPHKFVDTAYGKALIIEFDDGLEVYIGKDFGDGIGCIDRNYWFTSDAEIAKAVERLLG